MSSFRQAPKPHVAPFVGPAWPVAAAWLAAALLAQTTIVHYLAIRGIVPSLVLLVVVWYSVRTDARRAAVYGLVAGFCEDALAAHTGAAWTISTSLTAILASLLSRGFFADSIPLVAGITVAATLVRALFFWIVLSIFGYPPGLGAMHFHEALAQSAFNAGVMILAMVLARRAEMLAR